MEINSTINRLLNALSPWRIVIGVAILLLTGFLLWFGVTGVKNFVGRSLFRAGVALAEPEIKQNIDEGNAAKEKSKELLIRLAIKQQELAEKEAKLAEATKEAEIAGELLRDRTKTFDQKLRAYQEALRRQPSTPVSSGSNAELCEEAKRLGIELAICSG